MADPADGQHHPHLLYALGDQYLRGEGVGGSYEGYSGDAAVSEGGNCGEEGGVRVDELAIDD